MLFIFVYFVFLLIEVQFIQRQSTQVLNESFNEWRQMPWKPLFFRGRVYCQHIRRFAFACLAIIPSPITTRKNHVVSITIVILFILFNIIQIEFHWTCVSVCGKLHSTPCFGALLKLLWRLIIHLVLVTSFVFYKYTANHSFKWYFDLFFVFYIINISFYISFSTYFHLSLVVCRTISWS